MESMVRFLTLALFVAASAIGVLGHQAFRLVSSEKLTVSEAELMRLQQDATVGKAADKDLIFSGHDIRLVFTTGPEDDMLSYRLQGLRNPDIVTRSDVRITIW